MKSIMQSILVFALSLVAVSGFAQDDAISKYFNQYVDDDRFTVVYISPKMFDMFAKMDIQELAGEGDKEAKVALEVVKDLTGLRILTTEENPQKFYEEALAKLKSNKMESIMKVRSEGENVEFFVTDDGGDNIKELLLLVGGDEFVMLSFTGNINLKKIGKLANMMDVKGAEHLDELEKQ
jgi:hypothetical protein